MRARTLLSLSLAVAVAGLVLASCATLKKGGDLLTEENLTKVGKVATVVRNTFADITEEEEYYIGRSVAALILSRYNVYNNEPLNRYVNIVGNAVAVFSSRPEIFGGYHFLVLDSTEINAMAAPGGFIFITRGLLRECKDEEMLASVLAHEVGHVASKHGLQSIKKSRLIDAFKLLGHEVAKKYTPAELSQLTAVFEGALGDIAGSLIERGYDRKYEYEADGLSVKFGLATGYNPQGLADFLKNLEALETKDKGLGWFKTHPRPEDRLAKVAKLISGQKTLPLRDKVRLARFKQNFKG
ncbi:MAG: M48 family metalloprotease [Candidatus Aminicenantales bacterium]